jgi:hypothetical protein
MLQLSRMDLNGVTLMFVVPFKDVAQIRWSGDVLLTTSVVHRLDYSNVLCDT